MNIRVKATSSTLFFLFSAILLISCSELTITRFHRLDSGMQFSPVRNYKLGQQQTAYVGEGFIRVSQVGAHKYIGKHMKASGDFEIWGSRGQHMVGSNKIYYPVKGETTIAGKKMYIVDVFDNTGINYASILADSNGVVQSKIFNPGVIPALEGTTTVVPENLRFSFYDGEVYEDAQKAGVTQELVYGGTINNQIKIKYREYTSNGIAKQAFYQDLIYEKGQEIVRFRDFKIKVHEATNQKIVYTVLGDGSV